MDGAQYHEPESGSQPGFVRPASCQSLPGLACGLAWLVDLLQNLRFDEEDLAYLGGLRGQDGEPLFAAVFLDELRRFERPPDSRQVVVA